MQKLLMNFSIAVEAVFANRVRSVLTALGIIFGVAAVIAMLAIGNGAQQEILEQIKLVGVNNIVINPIVEQSEEDLTDDSQGGQEEKKKFSTGLTSLDAKAVADVLPGIEKVSPEIILDTYIVNNGIRRTAKLVGVEPTYFDIFNFDLARGSMFANHHLRSGDGVCIIGSAIQSKFFPTQDPLGKYIKCGKNWLKVIGILQPRVISDNSISNLGIRDYNMDVYVPIQTMLLRFKDRARVTTEMLRKANSRFFGDDNGENKAPVNYHQLDRLVIQVESTENMTFSAEVLARMLARRHFDVVDFEIQIPELLLKQQQRTNDIFNYVLFAIACISLLVGGIGIMNIMLASVMERIKEIGLRLSLGAQKLDIINQFLLEAMMISVTGGLLGVILGIVIAVLVSSLANIPTVITFGSIVLSFGVAASVGLIFGITPARRAASQDPIQSLRYE